MVKKISRKEIESISHKRFFNVAKNFYEAAELAGEFEYYNAAGVLFVHAAIALADAVTIRFASKKCTGENHYEIIALLNEVMVNNLTTRQALNHLQKIIDHKNAVSYAGDLYTKKDINDVKKHFERFRIWTEKQLM